MDKSGMADALDYALQTGDWTWENDIAVLLFFSPLIIGAAALIWILTVTIYWLFKKRISKKVIVLCIVLISALTLSAQSVSFQKIADRPQTVSILTNSQKQQINEETKGMTEKQIVNYSLKTTAQMLSFSKKNNILKGKANCVGYAKLCSEICNYAFQKNQIKASAKPVIGYIRILGFNIHPIAQKLMPKNMKDFVKDHDFVEIMPKHIHIDPILYDYGIKY